ncbi:MAG: hypothetical protein HY585_00330 [Candidatus Omnitrophica bacterium]|nr:hypothetical protein [Candidatus Omnitrophota bacterium]
MAEEKEKPENPVQQEKVEEKKPEPNAKAEANAESKVEDKKPAESAPQKKIRKVTRMTLAEVEAEIKSVKEKMGGFQSDFARHLLARKKELAKA